MSTFAGKLNEIPSISIDRFDGPNLLSECFFLSHCHQDHMTGLDLQEFQDKLLDSESVYLYVSHVSAEILKRINPNLTPKLRELDMYSSTTLRLKKHTFSVYPIPAGHCPGSVMLLFETDHKNILYTGDYRINPADLPKFKAFYNSFGQLKTVHKVHLDTTFFLKCYTKFPSRQESLEEICAIIKNWISKSNKHIIKLETCAKYGYEYLFMEIKKALKMPIHVNEEVFQFYNYVPEMDDCVTTKGRDTQIHCACGVVYTDICRNSISFHIKKIRISAWKWRTDNLQAGISEGEHLKHSVCYSTHASYEEGVELIKFLKPTEIEPSVLHRHVKKDAEIYRNIKENLEKFNNVREEEKCDRKFFKLSHTLTESNVIIGIGDETDALSSILDSPPRKKNK